MIRVRIVLSGSGAGGVTIWGRDLGVFNRNVQSTGGVPHRIPLSGDEQDDKKTVEWDLYYGSSIEFHQRSGEKETGGVH